MQVPTNAGRLVCWSCLVIGRGQHMNTASTGVREWHAQGCGSEIHKGAGVTCTRVREWHAQGCGSEIHKGAGVAKKCTCTYLLWLIIWLTLYNNRSVLMPRSISVTVADRLCLLTTYPPSRSIYVSIVSAVTGSHILLVSVPILSKWVCVSGSFTRGVWLCGIHSGGVTSLLQSKQKNYRRWQQQYMYLSVWSVFLLMWIHQDGINQHLEED